MDSVIIFGAKYLFVFVLLGGIVAGLFAKREAMKRLLYRAVIALPLALVIGKIANKLIMNPRPFVTEGVTPLIAHAPDNGFPSDHTLLAMTVAALVYSINKKIGGGLILLALLVGLARMLAKVHHGIDIAGSVAIAIVAVVIASIIVAFIETKKAAKISLSQSADQPVSRDGV